MDVTPTIQKKKNRFLIAFNHRNKLGHIALGFILMVISYITVLCINIVGSNHASNIHGSMKTLNQVTVRGFAALLCIVVITKLIRRILALYTTGISGVGLIRVVNVMLHVVIVSMMLKTHVWDKWSSTRGLEARVDSEATLKTILSVYVLLLSLQIIDDLESSSVTMIFAALCITVVANVLYFYRHQLESTMRPVPETVIKHIRGSISSEYWVELIGSCLQQGFPVLAVASVAVVISTIFLKAEESTMSCVKVSRKMALLGLGVALFILAFFILMNGIHMTSNTFKYLSGEDFEGSEILQRFSTSNLTNLLKT